MSTTTPVTLSASDFGGLTVEWPDGEPMQSVEWEGAVYHFRRIQAPDRFGDLVDTDQAIFTGISKPPQ